MTSVARDRNAEGRVYRPPPALLVGVYYDLAAWKRLPVDDVDDDSPSFVTRDSFFSISSRSTVPGPGAIAGKFLKVLGEKTLDLVVGVIIRRHLASIGRMMEMTPNVFYKPFGEEEWKMAITAYKDLHELCRESRREYYPLSLQRTAANLIFDITVCIWQTSQNRSDYDGRLSSTREKWEALLYVVWTRRRGDLLRELSSSIWWRSPGTFPEVGPMRTQSEEIKMLKGIIMRDRNRRQLYRRKKITIGRSRRIFKVSKYVAQAAELDQESS